MMRQAFTLIEVVIATFIASIVAGLLFMSFSQVNQVARISERRMDFETKDAWLHYYLERDLAGACLLLQPEEQQTTTAAQQGQQGKPAPKEESEKGSAKKVKKIEKNFVYTHQGTRFESLNFITNNALPKFWGAKETKLTPLIARVTYKLQEDKKSKGSFQLVRQEGPELDSEKFNAANIRGYVLVDGIKDLSLKFTAKFVEEIEEKKAEQAPQPKQAPGAGQQPPESKKEKKKIKVTFKDVDDWNSDSIEKTRQAAQKEKRKGPVQKLIPVYVEITGSFWDATKKRTMPFNFIVPIIADAEFKKREKPVPQIPTPPQQKPNQPPQGQGGIGTNPPPGATGMGSGSQDDYITEDKLKSLISHMFSPQTRVLNSLPINNTMMNGYNQTVGMQS